MASTVKHALEFVNLLVPGGFDLAKKKLSPGCEYHYSGQVLLGDTIIRAFEESHEKARASLERIDYLPARVDRLDDEIVVVGVSDRIRANGKSHTYSDRLAIRITESSEDWRVVRIEHRPIAKEREKLRQFMEELTNARK